MCELFVITCGSHFARNNVGVACNKMGFSGLHITVIFTQCIYKC